MERIKELHKQKLSEFKLQRNSINKLWNINEQTAQLLYILIKTKQPKNILEIGTSNGYSTFWISLAAEQVEANIDTIEVDDDRFEMANKNLSDRKNINLYFGKAECIIPKLNKNYDFVFIDANKADYIKYIRLLINKLNDKAIIIADNIISHKESLQEYLDYINSNSVFENMILDIDSGLEISVFKCNK
jgi:predicted O-methyltransferase YrrM